jgi:hypothetical protein
MAKPLDPRIADILKQYHPNPRAAVWDCHGTTVIYHKDVEIVAAAAGITFDKPVLLEANGKDKCVALCVSAHLGERSDWSIGEASPANNKNGYPYAMAEKRARDRVVIKLLGLSGFVYSEDESDDFRPPQQRQESAIVGTATAALRMSKTEEELTDWYAKNKDQIDVLRDDERDDIRSAYKTHLATLRQKEAA